jgi:hypothetical protein
MTGEQYRQLLQNRRRVQPRLAVDGHMDGRLLRKAAMDLRRRAAAERALERILPAEWADVTSVETLEGGTLAISVADAMVHEQIRRQCTRLAEDLARALPTVQRIHVLPAAGQEQPGTQRDGERGGP